MQVVVGLCAVLPFRGRPLLTGPWLLNSIPFIAGDQTKMDRSFPSCTTEHVHQQRQNGCFRDGIQRSNWVWICCCSLMKSWLMMVFYTKFGLVRSDDWWVSFTRPWAVFTRLGRPDEWLVWTLAQFHFTEAPFAALGLWSINTDQSALPIAAPWAIFVGARCGCSADLRQCKQNHTIYTNRSTAEPTGGIRTGDLRLFPRWCKCPFIVIVLWSAFSWKLCECNFSQSPSPMAIVISRI